MAYPSRRRRNPRSGQAALFMTLSLTAMIGLMGLVVDVGWAYWRKLACKTAAQSAALAAVKAASSPYSSQSSIACSSLTTGPLYVGCQYASANGVTDGGNGGKQSVKMAAGTSSTPVSGLTNVSYWVTATASETMPQWFSGVLGHTALAPSVRATATIMPPSGGCVYSLASSGTGIYESGGGALSSGCGVYVNSSANTATTPAVNLQPSSKITTSGGSKTYIVGGYVCGSGLNGSCVNGSSFSPMPSRGALPVSDPFASDMPSAPTTGSCTPFSIPSYEVNGLPYVLSPGTYCSQVVVAGSETLQLTSGTYVLEAGISAQASGIITATGPVTLYFPAGSAQGSITASGNARITLSAPSSGTYNGLLVWQPSGNTATASIAGSGAMTLNGAVYMPGAQFSYSGTGKLSGANLTLVANTLNLTGSATISNPASTPFFQGGGPSGNFLVE
ncbi:MAG TPA: pilus assembly protein TadG-related protein [Bryobacteraceae bacterium]|nr:pilus assembly protein TadG-related protein [Bryobacteraceae bacterium]